MENVFLILAVLKFKYGTSKTSSSFCYCGSNMANHVQLTAGIIMRECIQHSCIQDTQNLSININNIIITHKYGSYTFVIILHISYLLSVLSWGTSNYFPSTKHVILSFSLIIYCSLQKQNHLHIIYERNINQFIWISHQDMNIKSMLKSESISILMTT